jgi:hypothetical protein
MIYMPSFIMIDASIQNLILGGGFTIQHEESISLLLFFQHKESMLKILITDVEEVRQYRARDFGI